MTEVINIKPTKEIKELIEGKILEQERKIREQGKLIDKLCKNPPKDNVEMALIREFLKRTGININDFKRLIEHHQERIQTIKIQNSTINAMKDQIEAQKKKIEVLSKADVEGKEPKTIWVNESDAEEEIEFVDESDIKIIRE